VRRRCFPRANPASRTPPPPFWLTSRQAANVNINTFAVYMAVIHILPCSTHAPFCAWGGRAGRFHPQQCGGSVWAWEVTWMWFRLGGKRGLAIDVHYATFCYLLEGSSSLPPFPSLESCRTIGCLAHIHTGVESEEHHVVFLPCLLTWHTYIDSSFIIILQ